MTKQLKEENGMENAKKIETTLKARQAAKVAGIEYGTFIVLLRNGDGPKFVKNDFGEYRIKESDLKKWLDDPAQRKPRANRSFQDRKTIQISIEAAFVELLDYKSSKENSTASRLLSEIVHDTLMTMFHKPINEKDTINETLKRR